LRTEAVHVRGHESINRYLSGHNQDPRPFTRTADPQRVLAAVSRGNQALESLHSAAFLIVV
jgi:hypothetical protein